MAYAAIVLVSTDEIIQLWKGGDTLPIAPDASQRVQPLTEQEMQQIRAEGKPAYPDGTAKWKYPVGGPLTFVDDPRNGISFTPASISALVAGNVNATTTVDVQLYNPDNSPASYTGTMDFRANDGRWVRLAFSNGQATLTIRIGIVQEIEIAEGGPNASLRFQAPFRYRILANGTL